MDLIIGFIIIYILFLAFWLFSITLLFIVSKVIGKNLLFLHVGIVYIISFLIQIWLIIWAVTTLFSIIRAGEWLLLVLALVFGGFLFQFWSMVYGFLLFPFNMSAIYFVGLIEDKKLKSKNDSEKDYSNDFIDEEVSVLPPIPEDLKNNRESDPLLGEAIKYTTGKSDVTAEKLMKEFNIGYSRASRLMDQLRETGFFK